jgi:hypothetical protein
MTGDREHGRLSAFARLIGRFGAIAMTAVGRIPPLRELAPDSRPVARL